MIRIACTLAACRMTKGCNLPGGPPLSSSGEKPNRDLASPGANHRHRVGRSRPNILDSDLNFIKTRFLTQAAEDKGFTKDGKQPMLPDEKYDSDGNHVSSGFNRLTRLMGRNPYQSLTCSPRESEDSEENSIDEAKVDFTEDPFPNADRKTDEDPKTESEQEDDWKTFRPKGHTLALITSFAGRGTLEDARQYPDEYLKYLWITGEADSDISAKHGYLKQPIPEQFRDKDGTEEIMSRDELNDHIYKFLKHASMISENKFDDIYVSGEKGNRGIIFRINLPEILDREEEAKGPRSHIKRCWLTGNPYQFLQRGWYRLKLPDAEQTHKILRNRNSDLADAEAYLEGVLALPTQEYAQHHWVCQIVNYLIRECDLFYLGEREIVHTGPTRQRVFTIQEWDVVEAYSRPGAIRDWRNSQGDASFQVFDMSHWAKAVGRNIEGDPIDYKTLFAQTEPVNQLGYLLTEYKGFTLPGELTPPYKLCATGDNHRMAREHLDINVFFTILHARCAECPIENQNTKRYIYDKNLEGASHEKVLKACKINHIILELAREGRFITHALIDQIYHEREAQRQSPIKYDEDLMEQAAIANSLQHNHPNKQRTDSDPQLTLVKSEDCVQDNQKNDCDVQAAIANSLQHNHPNKQRKDSDPQLTLVKSEDCVQDNQKNDCDEELIQAPIANSLQQTHAKTPSAQLTSGKTDHGAEFGIYAPNGKWVTGDLARQMQKEKDENPAQWEYDCMVYRRNQDREREAQEELRRAVEESEKAELERKKRVKQEEQELREIMERSKRESKPDSPVDLSKLSEAELMAYFMNLSLKEEEERKLKQRQQQEQGVTEQSKLEAMSYEERLAQVMEQSKMDQ